MCLSRSHSPRMLWHLKQTYVGYVNLFSSGRIGKRFWWIFNQFRFSLDGYWSKHHDFLWFLWFILWISFCPISFQRFLFILYFWTIELNTWSHWILLPHRPLSRTFFSANHISNQSHLKPISSYQELSTSCGSPRPPLASARLTSLDKKQCQHFHQSSQWWSIKSIVIIKTKIII